MRFIILLIASFLIWNDAISQIPTEVFAGDKKAVIDIMFFKFFKKRNDENSIFLFFNRNKASIDYMMTSSTNLPQFGFTEAISYNLPALKGFAPVAVAQILNNGLYKKSGIQYAKVNSNLTVFGWLISELKNKPDIDFYLLLRYTPSVNEKIKIYTQLESLNNLPTSIDKTTTLKQNIRLGLMISGYAFGIGSDLLESKDSKPKFFHNIGGFLRYEFK